MDEVCQGDLGLNPLKTASDSAKANDVVVRRLKLQPLSDLSAFAYDIPIRKSPRHQPFEQES